MASSSELPSSSPSKEYYDMSNQKLCFVLSNTKYLSKKDEELIEKTWIDMDYLVHIYRELKQEEILRKLEEFATSSEKISIVTMFVLTHDVRKDCVYVGGELCKITKIFEALNALESVPKIMYIQNNRRYINVLENMITEALTALTTTSVKTAIIFNDTVCDEHYKCDLKLPEASQDIFIMHSDEVADEDVREHGSPMINELCKQIKPNLDFDEYIQRVREAVANYPF
ncbi:asb018 [Agrotis segetum nucleopolyhedrovirus B]|uniref:Asb018 n=1 Tax=Agrotis segetum nucleopolyhedrovirus B TaxID=1580580 RepID=A0A0A7KTA0_9ABAC|nr:asb018 [Agrotis segetum nucleopolyhedrovirus B]AIZ48576.1 asb018 [Agrotis segetum nucleopolyhedrovirus B]